MERFINFSLIANPYNWAIVILMVMFVGMATAFLFHSSWVEEHSTLDV